MGIYTEELLDEIEAYLAAAGFGKWPSPRKTSSSALSISRRTAPANVVIFAMVPARGANQGQQLASRTNGIDSRPATAVALLIEWYDRYTRWASRSSNGADSMRMSPLDWSR